MARYGQEFKEREAGRLEAVRTTAALASPGEVGTPKSAKEERQRIKELERELRREDKALSEVAALLVLSKFFGDLDLPKESCGRIAPARLPVTCHGPSDHLMSSAHPEIR